MNHEFARRRTVGNRRSWCSSAAAAGAVFVRTGIGPICLILSLAVAPLLSAHPDELPEVPFRRGKPVRLGDRQIDVRYFDLGWRGFIPHGADMLLPGSNSLWLLEPKNHSLRKAVEADWEALRIKPSDVLGLSDDLKIAAVDMGTTNKEYPWHHRLGVADLSESSTLARIDADWLDGRQSASRGLTRWKFDRKNKLAFALSCSHADNFAWLDWGQGKSITHDLPRNGAKPDSVSWTGFEMKPGVYCFIVECLWWKEPDSRNEKRKTWFRRITLNLTKGVDVEVAKTPFEIVDVIEADDGMALCRLKDGRLAWVDYRAWKLAATSGVKCRGGIARTSKRIFVNDRRSDNAGNSIVALDLKTLKKTASADLGDRDWPVWLGAFPQYGVLMAIDAFNGLQMFDIETLKKIDGVPGIRTGRTVNAGTLGVNLTQSGRYALVATPYANELTIFGLKNDFVRVIDRHPHNKKIVGGGYINQGNPSGAFHIKTTNTETLLIVTAPVPYE